MPHPKAPDELRRSLGSLSPVPSARQSSSGPASSPPRAATIPLPSPGPSAWAAQHQQRPEAALIRSLSVSSPARTLGAQASGAAASVRAQLAASPMQARRAMQQQQQQGPSKGQLALVPQAAAPQEPPASLQRALSCERPGPAVSPVLSREPTWCGAAAPPAPPPPAIGGGAPPRPLVALTARTVSQSPSREELRLSTERRLDALEKDLGLVWREMRTVLPAVREDMQAQLRDYVDRCMATTEQSVLQACDARLDRLEACPSQQQGEKHAPAWQEEQVSRQQASWECSQKQLEQYCLGLHHEESESRRVMDVHLQTQIDALRRKFEDLAAQSRAVPAIMSTLQERADEESLARLEEALEREMAVREEADDSLLRTTRELFLEEERRNEEFQRRLERRIQMSLEGLERQVRGLQRGERRSESGKARAPAGTPVSGRSNVDPLSDEEAALCRPAPALPSSPQPRAPAAPPSDLGSPAGAAASAGGPTLLAGGSPVSGRAKEKELAWFG